jgi:NADPH:quinone reductase-like Zn-dependent oxidoreductase
MKKIVIKPGNAGLDAIHIEELMPRELDPTEVRIRVHATSVNYKDLLMVKRGINQELIPLSDGAGMVEEAGSAVTRLKSGDRVTGLFFPLWQSGSIDSHKFSSVRGGVPTDGMLSQLVSGHEDGFLKFPDYLSYEEAATLPCAAVTAWNALIVRGQLKPGETVVILGTGGVALFGLQLAKTAGARVIMLSSSDEKLQKAKQMGADELINYRLNPDWEKQVLEKTGHAGADLILELGGPGTLAKSMASTKINGRISMVGVLTGTEGQVDPMPILRKTLSVNGIYVGSRDMQVQLHNALETNKIHPVIDRIFPFDKVRDAYEYMQSGKHFGKIIIQLG